MKRALATAVFSVVLATASVGVLATVAGVASATTPAVSQHTIVPGTWSIDSSPTPPTASEDAILAGTSCVSDSFCVAVGYVGPDSDRQTLIEQWNGTTWSVVTSPNTSTTLSNTLQSVSCLSTSFCVAVGDVLDGSYDQTLVEQWNGTTWSIVTSPDQAAPTNNVLWGVDCTSATSCTAVGYWDGVGGTDQTLVEQWNGTTWSIVTSPNTSTMLANALTSVSCTSTSSCTAVGDAFSAGGVDGVAQTLVEQWNGISWSIVTSPNASATLDNYLASISCTSSSFCVAVGNAGQDGSTSADENSSQTLVEQWNGSTWSIVTSANTSGGFGNYLAGVSCVDPTSCVATGYSYADSDADSYVTEVAAWNGASWSLQSSPNPTITVNAAAQDLDQAELDGVSCVSNASCVAVGEYINTGDYDNTLIESAPITRPGYRFVASDGGVFNYGGASFYGSAGNLTLNKPVVGMADTPDGGGYWLVASDGGIFSYGDAQFYGSTGSLTLNKPIVGMAATPDGNGYWLVASDGGIFNYGDAGFFGSAGSLALNQPIVGMAATPDGGGYWLVASDGGIFAYGDAAFYGSTGNLTLNKPIVGMAASPSGHGYWMVASDGGIFNYGDASFEGSAGNLTLNKPVVGMAATSDGGGYWLVASDGGVFAYGDAQFYGSTGNLTLNKPIVGMAA